MDRLWLASYDIADDKRRRRVARTLLGLGDRAQESLFECALSMERAQSTGRRLGRRIDPQQDRVALLPLCRDCQRAVRSFGLGRDAARPHPHFVAL